MGHKHNPAPSLQGSGTVGEDCKNRMVGRVLRTVFWTLHGNTQNSTAASVACRFAWDQAIQHEMREELPRLYLQLGSHWQLVVAEGKTSFFIRGVATDGLPMLTQAKLTEHSVTWRWAEHGEERGELGWRWSRIHCICVWNFQEIQRKTTLKHWMIMLKL